MKNQETTTIYINPVPRMSAQGRHKQVYTVQNKTGEFIPTTGMNKNKEFGVPSEYSFKLDFNANRLVTGLNKMIENPFKDLKPEDIIEQYGLSEDWMKYLPSIVKQSQIKLQTKFEIVDNVGYNFYTDEITGTIFSPNWKNNTKDRNFLESFKIILYDGPNKFSDDTPRGRLGIQLIKNHSKIAKSKADVNSSVHDWYISQEEEAKVEKQRKRDFIELAMAKWRTLKDTATPFTIYQVASLLFTHDGNPVVKGKMSDISVRERVSDFLYDDTSYQLENIEKFNRLFDMLQTKEGRERFYAMYLVGQALNTDVIKLRDGFYIWLSKMSESIYKHTSYDALVSTIQREYASFNPDDLTVTNWYKDLYEELTIKGVWLE